MESKPFYRIYRPFSESAMTSNSGFLYYVEDERYCKERIQLLRMYKMLQTQVIDTFQYVEPVKTNKDVYSLRYHQLYWNICAEIETNFRGILKANGYTRKLKTNENKRKKEPDWNIKDDYFVANSALKLNEYKLKSYCYEISNDTDNDTDNDINVGQPFANWNAEKYARLVWFAEHNSVKHDRSVEFRNANLKNVVTALAGLYILLFAQFGFLADAITNNGILLVSAENESYIPCGVNNDMGYYLHETPMYRESEKYNFNWDEIKTECKPFQCFDFNELTVSTSKN